MLVDHLGANLINVGFEVNLDFLALLDFCILNLNVLHVEVLVLVLVLITDHLKFLSRQISALVSLSILSVLRLV